MPRTVSLAPTARQLGGQRARSNRIDARIEWFDDQVRQGVNMGMRTRVKLAAQLLRDKVVTNISIPVQMTKSRRTGLTVVVGASRSVAGEFPRADTKRLMKDIFWKDQTRGARIEAIVGTTLDYGLILETRMNRSFLVRTLRQMESRISNILLRGNGQSDFPFQVREF